MASIFKCDRCGAVVDNSDFKGALVSGAATNPYKGDSSFHPPYVVDQMRELCNDCWNSFVEWLDGQ